MGRYYSGDIEGKFWFGLQSSDAANRFGGQESFPQHIDYYFSEDDLEDVNKEIDKIIANLGDKKEIIDNFLKDRASYKDSDLEAIGIYENDMSEYADLKLGIKIRDCIKEKGHCEFQAEI